MLYIFFEVSKKGGANVCLPSSERGKGRNKAVVEELNDKTVMSQVSLSDAAAMPECHELPEVFVDK